MKTNIWEFKKRDESKKYAYQLVQSHPLIEKCKVNSLLFTGLTANYSHLLGSEWIMGVYNAFKL